MKIAAAKVEPFINNPDNSVIAVLIYGPDTGLVKQRALSLGAKIVDDVNDPFSVVDISPDSIKEDSARFADEMFAISFGGGKRLIKVNGAGKEVVASLKDFFKDNVGVAMDSFAIFTAGDLAASSPLRKLFEAEKNIAALPCYHDDSRSLNQVVREELKKFEFLFNNDVVIYLAENCLGDRMVVLSEIRKLDLYKGEDRNLTFEDVQASIGETTESTFDDICNATAKGDFTSLDHHLHKAFEQGAAPIAILRVVQRFFSRLHSVIGEVSKGAPQDQALKVLRPPVFFKALPMFKIFVTKWSRDGGKSLWQASHILYEAELKCKETGVNAELMCSRLLMKIASLARKL